MANELRLRTSLTYTKGSVTLSQNPDIQIDVSGVPRQAAVVSVGTSEEAVAMGDVVTPGVILVKNLDATNFVQLGATTGVYTIRVKAGEVFPFRLDGTTLFAIADTAACDCEFIIFSD